MIRNDPHVRGGEEPPIKFWLKKFETCLSKNQNNRRERVRSARPKASARALLILSKAVSLQEGLCHRWDWRQRWPYRTARVLRQVPIQKHSSQVSKGLHHLEALSASPGPPPCCWWSYQSKIWLLWLRSLYGTSGERQQSGRSAREAIRHSLTFQVKIRSHRLTALRLTNIWNKICCFTL